MRPRPLILAAALAAAILPWGAASAQQKEYAYFSLQGKLTDPSLRRPMIGAIVRLTAGEEVHSSETDVRGVFSFDRLPVASYRVDITTAGGRVVRTARRLELDETNRTRLRLRLGRGEPVAFQVKAEAGGVSLDVPEPEVRWDRFWKELAFFVGGAAVLAL
ncbi:MAG TPA: carboxypeptidase-like regulatory domain-containing protein [Candidatus Polarisedimenticolia bacterium]|nr:carboxypeptidase-like regulatory domain-containing protein [Candidatus Polarisedimenticolia bacterium]